jgi:hypothetical protein
MWLKYHSKIEKCTHHLRRTDRAESGFALPLALGMGLVMIIVAASMIGRSQSDRTTTSFQKETNRALSVSEAGVIRVQSFLDRYKLLATKNLDRWTGTLNALSYPQANCGLINLPLVQQQAEVFKNHNWISLDASDRNKGRYRIVDYQYQAGIGKLTIAGEIDAYNTTQNSSNSTLKVAMTVGSESAHIAPPALWASTFKLSADRQINGHIRTITCPQITVNNPDGIEGIDRTNITEINNQPTGQIIADPFTSIPPPKIAPNTAILLPAITSSIQLPRSPSSDVVDLNGEYHYLVDIDSQTSGYSIKLQDIDRIAINVSANQKVNLYLKGDIDLGGSQTVNVDRSHPNLRIYGSDRTTKLTIKDNASITAFIHAPLADAQSIKSNIVNPHRGIIGALWVKSWDSATNQSQIPITEIGNWSDFGITAIEQPSQINPISYWQRVGN